MESFETPQKIEGLKFTTQTTPGSLRSPRKVKKTSISESVEYLQFKQDVASGKFEATDDDVKKLLLIPHFDPPDLDLRGEETPAVAPAKKKTRKPKTLTQIELYEIREHSKSRAAKIYDKRMGKYYKNLHKVIEGNNVSSESSFSFQTATKEKLQDGLLSLKKDVLSIQQQNEALAAHLLLLEKAKQQLILSRNCLINGMKWKQKEIQKCKQSNKKKGERIILK